MNQAKHVHVIGIGGSAARIEAIGELDVHGFLTWR